NNGRGKFQTRVVLPSSMRPRAAFSASPRSICAPAEPAAPKASRQNCSFAEAWYALFLIRSSANVLVSSSLSSSSTSSPLTMAPTGLIRSGQTREHSSAARSRAPMLMGPETGADMRNSAAWDKARPCHSEGDSAIVPSGASRARSQALSGTLGTVVASLDAAACAPLMEELTKLTAQAAETILDLASGSDVRTKADGSPVTAADEAAEALICAGLQQLAPALPIISEEQAARQKPTAIVRGSYFLVDPLDGTREFIAGRDEYTINIALMSDGAPLLGIICAPALH